MVYKDLGVNLTAVDGIGTRLGSLWNIIRNTFIDVFEDEAAEIKAAASVDEKKKKGAKAYGHVEWLQVVQGMKLKLIEPLRKLFIVTYVV